ncbi:MAG TPA: phosphoribosylglycinamide formyltransferase [Acidobacteriota bacterium]|nr:phosphoribosylglycinamide formyltransferase [Acidobacteriota bacterium]HOT01860.1 phosphoribosylglycinamide formyltransferase [Acidobacteriota bacterium]HQF87695.1 phosphoribosylglycinamide formyltransferase [Acidobacteriota bacterium]HQG93163.1 phosphoribosylglycinamide formyltransferase [Acidobacteriota bacterium]HQK88631.1 phosphoribosylglycinamide formyltransferase [Acidobacteriota bacterium]
MKRLGILLSGRGSNFLAIHGHIAAGRLNAVIAGVVSDQPDAPGLARARELGLPAFCVERAGRTKGEFEDAIAHVLEAQAVELVCLAGFMRVLGPGFIRRFPQRILNIHPSLLPAFPGLHAQRQALTHGVRFSGCTVHFVDEGVDSGPIVAQAVVPVRDDDTEEELAARILVEEHRLYAEAIAKILAGRWFLDGRRLLEKK